MVKVFEFSLLISYCTPHWNMSSGKDASHYNKLSQEYDNFHQMTHMGLLNLIKHYIPLKKTDTIVDIGGGTGEIVILLKKEFGIECPAICVEPNEGMIAVAAKKEGIIPIRSTAEEFLAQKKYCPMNLVLLSGIIHYLPNLPNIIEKIAEFLKADKGTCLIATYPFPEEVWFEAALKKFPYEDGSDIPEICKQKGLECLKVEWNECFKVQKDFWYQCLRGRFVSTLSFFTDEEIEKGIMELEEKYFDVDKFDYSLLVRGWILTPV